MLEHQESRGLLKETMRREVEEELKMQLWRQREIEMELVRVCV